MSLRIALIAGALAAASSTALADGNWLGERAMGTPQEPGKFFVSFGTEGGFQQLPRWNGTYSFFTGAGTYFFKDSPEPGGAGPGGAFGYVFPDGTVPPWLGARFRVAVIGSTWSGEARGSASNLFAAGTPVVLPRIDGTVISAGNLAANFTFAEALRVHRDGFSIGLRAAADFPVNPALVFTPSLSVYGGRTSDAYNYSNSFTNAAGAIVQASFIDERVRTREIGGDFAGSFAWQALPWLSFNAGARIGIVSLHSKLTGTDCISAGVTSCGNNAAFISSVSDSRSTIGIRTGATLGANLDMRFGILSIGGFFTYDSRVPGISNPAATTFSTAPLAPARIRFDDGFRYGGVLNLRIPLIWIP